MKKYIENKNNGFMQICTYVFKPDMKQMKKACSLEEK